MVVLVGVPRIFGDGAFDVKRFAGFQAVDVFGHGAVGVFLYYEVEEASLV